MNELLGNASYLCHNNWICGPVKRQTCATVAVEHGKYSNGVVWQEKVDALRAGYPHHVGKAVSISQGRCYTAPQRTDLHLMFLNTMPLLAFFTHAFSTHCEFHFLPSAFVYIPNYMWFLQCTLYWFWIHCIPPSHVLACLPPCVRVETVSSLDP